MNFLKSMNTWQSYHKSVVVSCTLHAWPSHCSVGRNGSSSVLTMSVSAVVPESVTKRKKKINNDSFLAILASFKNGRDMVACNFF